MAKAGPWWWRAITALLKLVFRLVVFALTGTWLRAPEDRDESKEPQDEASRALEEQALAAAPGGRSTARGASYGQADPRQGPDLAALEARLSDLSRAVLRLSRPGNLEPARAAVQTELTWLQRQHTGVGRLEQERALVAATEVLEAGVEQRRDPARGAWLAEVDQFAADCVEPVVELMRSHDDAGTRQWVSRSGRLGERARQLLQGSPLGVVVVSRQLSEDPARWPLLLPEVGRSLLYDVPGLADELYRRHALPAGVPLPHAHVGYGPEELHGAHGAWLETLFADVFTTLRIGPAYPRALMAALAEPERPARVYAASARGGWLSPVAPAALRVHVAMRALEVLGQHRQREALWDEWVDTYGEPDMFFFPTQEGSWIAAPAAYVLGESDTLVASLTTEPLQALHGYAFAEIPDLAFGHGDDANQRRLRELFAEGRGEQHAPYVILSAAAEAVAADGADPSLVAHAARRELSHGAVAVDAGPEAAVAGVVTDVRQLARALRDPAIIRDAMVLAAAFERPRSRWPQRRRS